MGVENPEADYRTMCELAAEVRRDSGWSDALRFIRGEIGCSLREADHVYTRDVAPLLKAPAK